MVNEIRSVYFFFTMVDLKQSLPNSFGKLIYIYIFLQFTIYK